MAKWRALHKQISLSTEVNDMSEFAQLLFDRALLHTDDWGVVSGDARQLLWMTMPGTRRPLEDFAAAVKEMVEAGLVWWYWPEGRSKPLIQFICFDDYQPKTLIGNRTKPRKPIHHEHPDYAEYTELHWEPVKNWNPLEINEPSSLVLSKSKSTSLKKRDTNLDHEAFKQYREIMCHSVDKAKRRKLVKCAEEFGMEAFVATLELWRDREYNPDNIKGITQAVERKAKNAPHQRGYDDTHDRAAARRQAAGR